MVFLIIFLLAIILGGSIYVGPISIRVIATCIMAILLLVKLDNGKSIARIDKTYIWLYLLFSLFMAIALMLNGEFLQFEFVKKFLAFNVVSIVAFFAIERFVNSSTQLKTVIITLLTIILFNNIITIMQYNGNEVGWAIGFLFSDIEKSVEKIKDHDSLLGISATPGIFGDVVKNALYIAVVTPMSFCLFRKPAKFFSVIFSSVVILTSLIAAFMTQQRAALGVLLFSMFLLWLIIFVRKPIFSLSIVIFAFIILFSIIDFQSIDLGRFAEGEDTTRERLASQAIDFIIANPLFGGPVSFLNRTGLPAHNMILDSYIYSGILGFIVMMLLFCKTIYKSINIMHHNIRMSSNSILLFFSAVCVLSCMVYGLAHNTSYLAGEVIVFILLAIMLKIEKLSKFNLETKGLNSNNFMKF